MDRDDDMTQVVAPLTPFPGYQLLRELGSGGMATVYLAREESLDRLVAIKVMSEELLTDEFVGRFDSEARTAAALRHPNIVVVHASGQTQDQPYIVFEYIDGGDLEQRLDAEGSLAAEEATAIGLKIAEALVYLHERGFIHRDLKPANILFSGDGEPILSDFGIAMGVAADTRLTRTGMSIGSPRYMSPEQLRGGSITPKSDMYGFGLVLLEMLGGRFPADSDPLLFASRAEAYEGLVRELLAVDPAVRPTAAECAAQLRLGVSADSNSSGSGLGSILRAALLPVGLSIMFGIWVVWRLWAGPTVQVAVAPDQAELYLDGRRYEATEIELKAVPQVLVVVATGFVGQSITLAADTPSELSLVLAPLEVPTAKQFLDFHALFDDVAVRATRLLETDIGYALFDELLALRALGVESPAAAQGALRALELRADAGDAAAQVGGFLLATEGFANFSASRIELWLKAASSRGGYSLASYYRALHYRQQQGAAEVFGEEQLATYNNLLELARQQGLPFSSEQLRAVAEPTE